MKVFIAGATGALGLPLVRALVARHHEVIGMTRAASKQALLEQLGAQAVVADVFDAPGLTRVIREVAPTHVVHMLTALPKNGPMRVADIAPTNRLRIEGTANLLQAAIAAGVQRIVAESFTHVYGYGNVSTRALTEDDVPKGPPVEPGLQAVIDALRSLEAQVLRAHEQGQLEAVALRYGLTYGPENPSTQLMLRMLRKRWMPTLRGAEGVASFIHIDDAASATIAALEHDHPGTIYNIVDDEPISFNQFIVAAAQAIGARQPRALPRWLVKPIMPTITVMMDSRLPISNARTRRELAWQPRFPSYREGLQQVARQLASAATWRL